MDVLPHHRTVFRKCLEDLGGDALRLVHAVVQWSREEGGLDDTAVYDMVYANVRLKALREAVGTMTDGDWARAHAALLPPPDGHFPYELDDESNNVDEILKLRRALKGLGLGLEKRFEEMRLLMQVTTCINSGLLIDEVLGHVWETFRRIIPYNRIGFALLEVDDKGVEWVVARWARSDSDNIQIQKGFRLPLAHTSLSVVMQSKRPRILNDLEVYYREHPKSKTTPMILREGGRSSLTCPLTSNRKSIGVLFFTSFQTNTYQNVHCATFMELAGQLSTIVEKSSLYEQLLKEQQRGDTLLLNILPPTIADRLKDGESTIADHYKDVSILFADLVGFTATSSIVAPGVLVGILNQIYTQFDATAATLGVSKVKTIGDSWMGATGVPDPRQDHAEVMAEMALTMVEDVRSLQLPLPQSTPYQFGLRVGISTGSVVAGVIGKSTIAWDMWGDSVNMASRMESHSEPGKIQVTQDFRDLVESRCPGRFTFLDRGSINVKGKGPMHTFYLERRHPSL